MATQICAFEDCDNPVTEEDYCPDCGCYICLDHDPDRGEDNLFCCHEPEDHWRYILRRPDRPDLEEF